MVLIKANLEEGQSCFYGRSLMSRTVKLIPELYIYGRPFVMNYLVCAMNYLVCAMNYLVCELNYLVCAMNYLVCAMNYLVCAMN